MLLALYSQQHPPLPLCTEVIILFTIKRTSLYRGLNLAYARSLNALQPPPKRKEAAVDGAPMGTLRRWFGVLDFS